MIKKPEKILIITDGFTPYRIPLFNSLNEQFRNSGYELLIVLAFKRSTVRMWELDTGDCNFKFVVLETKSIRYRQNIVYTYPGIFKLIDRYKPQAIVVIGFSVATTKLWLRSFFIQTPYMIWSGSRQRDHKWLSPLRRWQRKQLVKRASGFLAYGTDAKNYLISLGAPSNKVSVSVNTVDTRFFAEKTKEIRAHLMPMGGKKHLTYIGRLSKGKNVVKALEVIQLLAKSRHDFLLDVIGDGEERQRLEGFVERHNLSQYVRFHGYKQKDELPVYLAKSSCFLFQTDFDIWGLVLNEAMAAGVPCLASVNAGSTHDLIREGETGFAVDFSEKEKVVAKINWLLDNSREATEIASNARRFINQHASLNKSAAQFIKAVQES